MNQEIRTQLERLGHGGVVSSDSKGNLVLTKPREFVCFNGADVCVTVSVRPSAIEERAVVVSANTHMVAELSSFFDWLDAHAYKYWYHDPGHCYHSV